MPYVISPNGDTLPIHELALNSIQVVKKHMFDMSLVCCVSCAIVI